MKAAAFLLPVVFPGCLLKIPFEGRALITHLPGSGAPAGKKKTAIINPPQGREEIYYRASVQMPVVKKLSGGLSISLTGWVQRSLLNRACCSAASLRGYGR